MPFTASNFCIQHPTHAPDIAVLPPLWVRDERVLGPEDLYPPDSAHRTWVECVWSSRHSHRAPSRCLFRTDVQALGRALLALSDARHSTSPHRALELHSGEARPGGRWDDELRGHHPWPQLGCSLCPADMVAAGERGTTALAGEHALRLATAGEDAGRSQSTSFPSSWRCRAASAAPCECLSNRQSRSSTDSKRRAAEVRAAEVAAFDQNSPSRADCQSESCRSQLAMRTLPQTGAGKGGQVSLAILKLDVLQVGLGQQRPVSLAPAIRTRRALRARSRALQRNYSAGRWGDPPGGSSDDQLKMPSSTGGASGGSGSAGSGRA